MTNLGTRLRIGLATMAVIIAGVASSAVACVVGLGTSVSCTEAALDACLPGGGSFDGGVTFKCGGPKTIIVTNPAGKPITANTSINGAGGIAISGNDAVPVFEVDPGIIFNVHNLTITHGNGDTSGGGIRNSGTLIVFTSTFSDNRAPSQIGGAGGAIFNTGTVSLTNTTLSGNSCVMGNGGGIYNSGGTVTITNCTFSGNSAFFGGGGIFLSGGTVTVTNSIIAQNSFENCSGPVIDGGHNLEDAETCDFTGATCALVTGTSFCNTPPGLAPNLANNGGPTQTLALLAGSAAIGNADSTICAAPAVDGVDQRGFARDNLCDIGAFELRPPVSAAPALSPVGLLGLTVLLMAVGVNAIRVRRRS